jgi:hypothetical protein
MGRMKELCIEIMEANGGIPEGMTIGDIVRMKELEIYEWHEYERQQEKNRLQQYQQENTGETGKVEQVSKKFSPWYGEARTEKNSEQ